MRRAVVRMDVAFMQSNRTGWMVGGSVSRERMLSAEGGWAGGCLDKSTSRTLRLAPNIIVAVGV